MKTILYTIACFSALIHTENSTTAQPPQLDRVGVFYEGESNEYAAYLAGTDRGIILDSKHFFSIDALDLRYAGEIAYEKMDVIRMSDDDAFIDQGFSRVKRN